MMPALPLDTTRLRQHLPRRFGLATAVVLLLAVAGVVAWMTGRPGGDDSAVTADKPVAATPALAPTPAGSSPAETAADAEPVDIFAVRTWEPEAEPEPTRAGRAGREPEPPPPPEPPPESPPLPFRFLGRIVEPGKAPTFMLSGGSQVFNVRVGDSVGDSGYQLEQYQDGNLIFLYPSMNARQTLSIGEAP